MSGEPKGLRSLQAQFSTAMSAPIRIADPDGDFELAIERYPTALVSQMVPAHGRSGVERLGVYNQQYWFRLLSVLQEEYPLLCDLMGVVPFNRMAVAFLTAHPSRSPLLRHLSDPLRSWMAHTPPYDSAELLQCAELEHHYIVAFDAEHRPVLDPTEADPTRLLNEPLDLQPHWALFAEQFDLVDARRRVRAGAEPARPLTTKDAWWAIYRRDGLVAQPLGRLQFELLTRLAAGHSLTAACDDVLSASTNEESAFIAQNIQSWFARWIQLGWFCQASPPQITP